MISLNLLLDIVDELMTQHTRLIQLLMLNALRGEPLPIYGDGSNVRDWWRIIAVHSLPPCEKESLAKHTT